MHAALPLALLCAVPALAQHRALHADAGRVTGTIRSFQGVNGGPAPLVEPLPSVARQYRELRIDLVRTHDYFGPGDIDAHWTEPLDPISRMVRASGANAIFPDARADASDPKSYNFGPTDRIIEAIAAAGAEVYFRIGRSWGADPEPPASGEKFADIVRHVAMHYNAGWAGGSRRRIRYWEFWNEPDLRKEWAPSFIRPFWTGTPEQFYTLYEETARALKAFDPQLKIGACGKAQPDLDDAYLTAFLRFCAARRLPLDFYSWHRYSEATHDPYDMTRIAARIRTALDNAGYKQAENIVSEWNMTLSMGGMQPQGQAGMENAAFTASALLYMQDSALDRALYYRGDATSMGLFNRDGTYRKKAYAFEAAAKLLDTPQRIAVTGADRAGFAAVAGRSADGRTVQILISNYATPRMAHPDSRGYALVIENLPWGAGEYTVERYRTTDAADFARVESQGKGARLELEAELPAPGFELVVVKARPPQAH